MRGTPPSGRSGSGGRRRDSESNGDPNRSMSGGMYRGGPMSPGPRPSMPPGATYGSRDLPPEASRTITPSRANPRTSMSGTMWQGALRSMHMPTVTTSVAPPEKLWSGNIGRLWFSEMAATVGDVILGGGVVIWFAQLTRSFQAVALLLLALAVPVALVTIFAGSLASRRDPRRLLSLLGILRIALALLFVAMYFDTINQIVYLLAFSLALATSMRAMLRRGAIAHGVPVRARGLLGSGDQVAAGVIAVAAPAIATLLYVLNGERIFTISLGAAICYFLAFIGETQVEPLPDKILFQRPANAAAEEPESVWEDEDEDSQVVVAEKKTPVWELEAAPNTRAAFADVNAGLQIAGSSSHALTALVLIALLALAGGMLAAIEPFYVTLDLHQSPFMLGFFFTATGLGAALASAIVVEVRSYGRIFLIIGALGSGVGLILLAKAPGLRHALAYVLLLGAMNVIAIRGGQMTLLRHFVPVEQRAAAVAMSAVRSVMAPLGIIGALLLLTGFTLNHVPLPSLGILSLMGVAGTTVIVAGLIAALPIALPNRETVGDAADEELDDIPADDDEDLDDESAEYSRYTSAHGRYDDSAEYSRYQSARGRYPDESAEYSAEYEAPRRRRAYEDDEDEPPRSGGRSRRR